MVPGQRRLKRSVGVILVLAAACARPAAAQVAGKLSLQSDYEIRGYSVSQGRPVGILDLAYDATSGVYLDGSAFGALPRRDDPGLLGLIGDIGYARRLGMGVSVDGGVSRTEYSAIGSAGYRIGYTDIYGGLSVAHLTARLHFSPDYFRPGSRTVYGEIDGTVETVADIRLNAHIGLLGYLGYPERPAGPAPDRTSYDWRIGASRQFGAFDVHAALSGGGPSPQDYDGERHSRTRFIVGAGYTF